MKNSPLPRLDENHEIRERLLPYCRLTPGKIWFDPMSGHKVACVDATDSRALSQLTAGERGSLAIQDPPYNVAAFPIRDPSEFIAWSRKWIGNTISSLSHNSSLYVWLGADQNNHFQPLAEFIMMMRSFPVRSRSLITMRNQRGYGTQKNWMAVRQELLYYTIGEPKFNVEAEYTDIPKILRGYYKEVGGARQENLERSNSEYIRAGNVWVDIQQVFYRMDENVSGCYAQKPLKAIERILQASSAVNDLVLDFFSHSGTTLLGCERLRRRCFTAEVDPVFCEITIRRLEHFRTTGRIGWQNHHPFEKECPDLKEVAGEEDTNTTPQSPAQGALL
jgi:site-specific DNA-methyltransferase (adenine-specific)